MESGFGRHKSGLLVPNEHARTREVWTNDDWKRVKRAIVFLDGRAVGTQIQCKEKDCPSPALQPVDGALVFTLRCGCKDRLVYRT